TEGGGFTVQTLPTTAFRPFSPYVSYTRERDTQPLTPDVPPTPLILPAYSVRELRATGRRPRAEREGLTAARHAAAPPENPPQPANSAGGLQRPPPWSRRHAHADAPAGPRADVPSTTRIPRPLDSPAPSNSRDDRRAELEARFLQESASVDRAALWPELASVYASLNRHGDAAVCWLNAMWEHDSPRPDWARGWLRAEARLPRGRGDEARPSYWLPR